MEDEWYSGNDGGDVGGSQSAGTVTSGGYGESFSPPTRHERTLPGGGQVSRRIVSPRLFRSVSTVCFCSFNGVKVDFLAEDILSRSPFSSQWMLHKVLWARCGAFSSTTVHPSRLFVLGTSSLRRYDQNQWDNTSPTCIPDLAFFLRPSSHHVVCRCHAVCLSLLSIWPRS